jgi:hypothetical protein
VLDRCHQGIASYVWWCSQPGTASCRAFIGQDRRCGCACRRAYRTSSLYNGLLMNSLLYRQPYQSLPHFFTKIPTYSLTRRRSIQIVGSSLTLASSKIIWSHSQEALGVVLESSMALRIFLFPGCSHVVYICICTVLHGASCPSPLQTYFAIWIWRYFKQGACHDMFYAHNLRLIRRLSI